jgi:hypothetical protein
MASAPWGSDPGLPGPNVLGFIASAAVLRRKPFLDTGGFDPVLFFMGEEDVLAYDARGRRLGVGILPGRGRLARP